MIIPELSRGTTMASLTTSDQTQMHLKFHLVLTTLSSHSLTLDGFLSSHITSRSTKALNTSSNGTSSPSGTAMHHAKLETHPGS